MAHLALVGGKPVRQTPFPRWPVWDTAEIEAVTAVIASGRWGADRGTEVRAFEQEFAVYQDAAFGIAVVNGTVALKLALTAAGVGVGDEVIVPGYTFVATATAALEIGAVPIFADIDPQTYTLDPASAAACVTARTRAIIPVHLGGRPADMDALLALARQHDLGLIEDAAQAWGSAWCDHKVGALGHIGGVSFQSSKNISAGEGGMLLTNEPALAEMAQSLSNCGRRQGQPWYAHYVLGGNYRLSELQGAILRVQLQRYPGHLRQRQANATYLEQAVADLEGITTLRQDDRVTAHAYHIFFLRYDASCFGGASKTRFIAAMQAEGIDGLHAGYSLPAYRQPVMLAKNFGLTTPPLFHDRYPDVPGYQHVYHPVTERACAKEAIWLRHNMLLGERGDMDDIVAALEKVHHYSDELRE